MEPIDPVARVVAEWAVARPDLDATPLELVGRVLVIAERLTTRVEVALKPFGLTLGQFDILATLRRQPLGKLSPGGLLTHMALTSGGMTARLDRLESLGLVVRGDDPDDRRGVVVALTTKGRKLIDKATTARMADAASAIPKLSARERAEFARLLANWVAAGSEV